MGAGGVLDAGPVQVTEIGVGIEAETAWTNDNAIRWHDVSSPTSYVAMINAHSQATPAQRHTLELRSWPKASHKGALCWTAPRRGVTR